jgi:NitT/TauT family transport system substrate-binding protein
MKRRIAIGTMASVLAIAATPRKVRAANVLRIAVLPIDSSAQCYYAQDQGFFRDAAIDVQIQPISNGAAVAAALASGSIDIGFSNLVSVAVAFNRGVPVTIVAPAGLDLDKSPTTALVVQNESPIKRASDLNGKTVAVNGLRNITQYATQAWVDKYGGDSSTIQFVEMPFPTMIDALKNGRIDAALQAEPFVTEARKNDARILADAYAAIGPRILVGTWIASLPWARAHASLIRDFAKVMARTATWANGDHQGSAAILAKFTKLDATVARQMGRVTYGVRCEIPEMQPVVDVSAHYGALSHSFSADELIFKG